MDFYIIRHGETKESRSHTEYDARRIKDAPILDDSKPVIKRIAEFLDDIDTDFNVSSPYLRCRQTVEIVGGITNKKFVYDDRIGECLLITNQETFDEFVSRVSDFLKDIKNKELGSVLICTHGAVIAALKHLMVEEEFKKEQLIDFPKPSTLTMIKDNKIYEKNFE